MCLFQKRHYEWLARWAGENLSPEQIASLSAALRGTNPNYQHDKFICRADDISATQPPKRASDLLYLPRRRASGAI